MSLKLNFLRSHLEFFSENEEAVSIEHGDKFHRDISEMDKVCSGEWRPNMIATPTGEYKRQGRRSEYLMTFFFVVRVPNVEALFII